MPDRKWYPHPERGALQETNSDVYAEYRDGETLVWDEEWYESAAPLFVLPGLVSITTVDLCMTAYLAGRELGHDSGHAEGFAACQAGLRALLGAASAADAGLLLAAAEKARR
jgi:hypothetical protein